MNARNETPCSQVSPSETPSLVVTDTEANAGKMFIVRPLAREDNATAFENNIFGETPSVAGSSRATVYTDSGSSSSATNYSRGVSATPLMGGENSTSTPTNSPLGTAANIPHSTVIQPVHLSSEPSDISSPTIKLGRPRDTLFKRMWHNKLIQTMSEKDMERKTPVGAVSDSPSSIDATR